MQKIIDNCDAGDSGMDKCADAGFINDASTTCNIPNLVPEPIDGVLERLPGNNPPTGWGQGGEDGIAKQKVRRHIHGHSRGKHI